MATNKIFLNGRNTINHTLTLGEYHNKMEIIIALQLQICWAKTQINCLGPATRLDPIHCRLSSRGPCNCVLYSFKIEHILIVSINQWLMNVKQFKVFDTLYQKLFPKTFLCPFKTTVQENKKIHFRILGTQNYTYLIELDSRNCPIFVASPADCKKLPNWARCWCVCPLELQTKVAKITRSFTITEKASARPSW